MKIGLMKHVLPLLLFVVSLLASCTKQQGKVVVCIPVYGQSLALAEEAERVTDFDSLAEVGQGRIVTERMDHQYGYFDLNRKKQWMKRMLGYKRRAFELSVYGMAGSLVRELGADTLVCIFPGGRGATAIAELSKGSEPYRCFLEDVERAFRNANDNGWAFVMPAVCWMQGESDLFDYTNTDYKQALSQFARDLNADVKRITGQADDVRMICYQTNLVTCADRFSRENFHAVETAVPQAMMELVRDDTLFWASGPTYPYTFARELKHIDGVSQNRLGQLAALSAMDIIRDGTRRRGLVPLGATACGTEVVVRFNVPSSPLVLDTLSVVNPGNYGFSVITPDSRDIASMVTLQGDSIVIRCKEQAEGCKVRYAVNGEPMKSGWERGPRGNLRDSQGEALKAVVQGRSYPLSNWCYQFDMLIQ